MQIKSFIIIIYTIAGLIISALSAFMTFTIIGEEIGTKMFLKIVLTIIFMLPIIGFISYFFGKYLSKKFTFIQYRLDNIKEENFIQDESKNIIYEINEINQNLNFLSKQMDNLIKDLKQKNRDLSNLLISMAHDIKTPLTILNGYIDEIEDGFIKAEDLPSILTHMKDEVKFLDELTIDMLEFITSMKNHKAKSTINLYDFLNNEIFPVLPKSKNTEYINNVNKEFTLEFNKVDLKKICINLLQNGIKHTDNGYIKVSTENKIIKFINNGKKIDEEYKDKIFEPFFTIAKSKNRNTSGFGLGLSIVRNLGVNNGYTCYLDTTSNDLTVFNLEETI